MPEVKAEIVVNAPLDTVYAIAKDIERFPDFMEDVQEVTILEKTPERQVSKWVGAVREFNRTITWTEEDYWDDENHVCTFRQIEGDFTSYEGIWRFAEHPDGTLVELEITYEFNIPLIGPLIKGLLQKKFQQNCQSMLEALKREAERRAAG